MLKAEQVPENVWCEVALRLEAYGIKVTDRIAKVVAMEAINAWPGMVHYPVMEIDCTPPKIVLPLLEQIDQRPRRTLDEMRGVFEEAYKNNREPRDD